jgi:hypothetical protein
MFRQLKNAYRTLKGDNLTAREMLNEIDNFFVTATDDESVKLAQILAALRGPDDRHEELKYATTAIIRAKAFPKLYKQGHLNEGFCKYRCNEAIGWVQNEDTPRYLEIRNKYYFLNAHHFLTHAVSAFLALGLEWKKVNK